MKRRDWLLAATGSGLLVAWGVLPQRSRLGAGALLQDGGVALNGWIKMAADGAVVLAMPRSEMGQGVHTTLPMLAAEELDVPLASVRIEQAGADAIYGNVAMALDNLPFRPQQIEHRDGFNGVKASRWVVGKLAREMGINITGGSSSMMDAWDLVRSAAATARAALLGAASLQWKLPLSELVVEDGVVRHPSGRSARYGELARFAVATPPGAVTWKAREAWRLIGRPAARLDVPAKVDGSAVFGIDARPPGLRFAALRLCPISGGAPARIHAAAALAMPGGDRLVMLPAYAGTSAGFAVIAATSWHAMRAAQAVQVEWEAPSSGLLDSRRMREKLHAAVRGGDGFTFHRRGDVEAVEAAGETAGEGVVEAWYETPFLAHATLEPMNCTAKVTDGRVELWVPTQVPQLCAAAAARVAGVPEWAVDVHVTLLGGGFGRRLEVDYAVLATRVAMDMPGTPVQLLCSREEDIRHDFYRPMQGARLRAALDGRGGVKSLLIETPGDAITPRWLERCLPVLAGPVDLPDKRTVEGSFDLPYEIPSLAVRHTDTHTGMPVGFWRSVGHSHNAFFVESFVDELATTLRVDPVELRRQMLRESPRHVAVLQLAAEKSGWAAPLPPGRARGIALHESFGSVVAQVAEVSIAAGAVRVHRFTCAADCGTIVNPAVVAQQMESAIVYGLTAALWGQVDVRNGAVVQGNFPAQPMLRLAAAPVIDTWFVQSRRDPAGAGEPGVPPVAPAVANALFRLTGRRQRSLPLIAQDGNLVL